MDIVYSFTIGFFSAGLVALIVAVCCSVKRAFTIAIDD